MSDKRYKIVRQLKNQIAAGNNRFFDKVQISLNHETKHINYFTYTEDPAGWYLHFSPVIIEDHGSYQATTTQLFHNKSFKIRCNEALRFSQKKFEKFKQILNDYGDKIAEYYDNNENEKLVSFVKIIFNK